MAAAAADGEAAAIAVPPLPPPPAAGGRNASLRCVRGGASLCCAPAGSPPPPPLLSLLFPAVLRELESCKLQFSAAVADLQRKLSTERGKVVRGNNGTADRGAGGSLPGEKEQRTAACPPGGGCSAVIRGRCMQTLLEHGLSVERSRARQRAEAWRRQAALQADELAAAARAAESAREQAKAARTAAAAAAAEERRQAAANARLRARLAEAELQLSLLREPEAVGGGGARRRRYGYVETQVLPAVEIRPRAAEPTGSPAVLPCPSAVHDGAAAPLVAAESSPWRKVFSLVVLKELRGRLKRGARTEGATGCCKLRTGTESHAGAESPRKERSLVDGAGEARAPAGKQTCIGMVQNDLAGKLPLKMKTTSEVPKAEKTVLDTAQMAEMCSDAGAILATGAASAAVAASTAEVETSGDAAFALKSCDPRGIDAPLAPSSAFPETSAPPTPASSTLTPSKPPVAAPANAETAAPRGSAHPQGRTVGVLRATQALAIHLAPSDPAAAGAAAGTAAVPEAAPPPSPPPQAGDITRSAPSSPPYTALRTPMPIFARETPGAPCQLFFRLRPGDMERTRAGPDYRTVHESDRQACRASPQAASAELSRTRVDLPRRSRYDARAWGSHSTGACNSRDDCGGSGRSLLRTQLPRFSEDRLVKWKARQQAARGPGGSSPLPPRSPRRSPRREGIGSGARSLSSSAFLAATPRASDWFSAWPPSGGVLGGSRRAAPSGSSALQTALAVLRSAEYGHLRR